MYFAAIKLRAFAFSSSLKLQRSIWMTAIFLCFFFFFLLFSWWSKMAQTPNETIIFVILCLYFFIYLFFYLRLDLSLYWLMFYQFLVFFLLSKWRSDRMRLFYFFFIFAVFSLFVVIFVSIFLFAHLNFYQYRVTVT